MTDPGVLVLAGTPIGHAEDASPALLTALTEADVIAAEDTRRFRDLCRRLAINPTATVVSFFDGNEGGRVAALIDHLEAGRRVVVVSDAGMPAVSDPGYRLVAAAADAGIRVTAVPGPSAVLTALAVSGLPTDRFCFEGFLPRKGGERRARLAGLAAEPRTMVFFEAPHRLAVFLADAEAALGADRRAVVCRELTKTYEEVRRGTLAELRGWAEGEVRGELTVVVEGAQVSGDPEGALAAVQAAVASGQRLSEAVAEVAAAHGVPRRQLYDAALKSRGER
ncbi:16S rRNA (cytidine(1402)-2'-O)-methyltransferase [Micropruina glycogenica]|jgi:16S rRNA (cytidine1402-2'-O)-methyltransferase|uniref:Ribosomal RNA small subunit methyltransferase I n=1 Tax=Micropruina glycogenica TaxID=75385 RepID=A0A2N9JLI6_9ACTN|nr:16S rRNA (cytidine(1402)-2'-O)-methyltransferase [Micropruina glycogenica]SPD88904.1 Ribosomal RNA small subunit methyltransferase I [Micropruina glycogenica]